MTTLLHYENPVQTLNLSDNAFKEDGDDIIIDHIGRMPAGKAIPIVRGWDDRVRQFCEARRN